MSDSKNPTLSEIRARVQAATEAWNQTRSVITPPLNDIPHLLDLVSRMGEALVHCDNAIETAIYNEDGLDGADGEVVLTEARALLEEIRQ